MDIITRSWITDSFKLHDNGVTYDYTILCDLIDKWKYLLTVKLNATKGMTFGFTITKTDIRYFSLIFACAELGLKIVVYQRPYKQSDIHNYKIKAFVPIDLMVYDDDVLNDVIDEFINTCSTTSFNISEIDLVDKPLDINYPTVFPDDILLLTTSSGTTDTPKIISHSHRFFYQLCIRNCSVLDFNNNDNILHVRNLHHGSSVSVFFFPSVHACSNHFYLNFQDEDMQSLSTSIENYDITKLLVPYNIIMSTFSKFLIENNLHYPQLTVFNLSYLEKEWITLCNNCHVLSIKSVFGSNETGGPIFLPEINKLSNTLTFDNSCVGPILDDFYKPQIIDNSLHVYISCYNKWINLEDSFSQSNEDFFFLGKDRLIRVNDFEFKLSDISEIVHDTLPIDHVVVLDENKLYLAIFDDYKLSHDDLNMINLAIQHRVSPLVHITKYCNLNKLDFVYGIKLDNWKIRKHFRDYDNQN